MPHIIHRSRWKSPPSPGRRVQLNHPLAHRLWSAAYFSNHYAHDALKDVSPLVINAGTSDYKSRVYRGGRYRTIYKVTGGTPYWYNLGRVGLAATSSITLMGLMGGDGRSTFRSLRCQLSTGVAGSPYPGLYEGDGTNNVWSAGFLGAGAVTVSAHGTSPAGQLDAGRVVTAVYRNGVGLELWVDGVQEAFTSSTLNLNGAPAFWQATGAATILEFPAIMLAWDRPLTGGEIGALSENPFQVLGPARNPTFYSLGAGAATLTVSDLAHAHAADAITLTQAHALAVGDAAHAHAADAVALTQAHQLAATDATHAHAADGIVLGLPGALEVQNVAHGHLADAVTLAQVHVLAVADALHPHALDALNLSGAVDLVVDAATHGHAVDAVALAQVHELLVANNEHLHTAEGLTLAAGLTLAVADALHEHALDPVSLGQVHALVVSDAVHAHLATHLGLSIPGGSQGPHTIVVRGQTRTIVVIARSRIIRVAPVTVQ